MEAATANGGNCAGASEVGKRLGARALLDAPLLAGEIAAAAVATGASLGVRACGATGSANLSALLSSFAASESATPTANDARGACAAYCRPSAPASEGDLRRSRGPSTG